MGFLALVGIGVLVTLVVLPWIAFAKAGKAQAALHEAEKEINRQGKRIDEALAQIALLRLEVRSRPPTERTHDVAIASTAKLGSIEPEAAVIKSAPLSPMPSPSPEASAEPASEDTAELPQFGSFSDDAVTRPVLSVSTDESPERKPAPSRPPPKPPTPSAFEIQMAAWIKAGKEWLFGGNLVAKVGLLILFIGVAFLVRLASNYVTVPIEFRLAGIAAGAIALLVWAWRIRESRRGIALPAQGAALAILMLVTFGAFKLFHVLPGGATFAMLFVLVAFTCVLAVLQDALWLAVFGIAGGFAAPILTSTGGGSHVALFSYYCLLNAGVLAIALKRSWRLLNLLGFAFTFVIGAVWGVQRYVPENYATSQAFLIIFWLFYIAIAVTFAWRRAPQLKSYVDGTLVFGVPMAGMALQYGLVKDIHFGMAISALCVALTYAITASALWRWRRGNLRLLVESFLALAVVFGTLAIPLAFDGRWTSAAWAVEGAAIVWIGLRQKQKLAWQFGVAVQLGSWVSFLSALTGLNPLAALRGNVGLGFLLLGGTGVLMALMFRHVQTQLDAEQRSRQRFGWLASGFISVAVLWLLLGMWVEVWLRLHGAHRATLLVATALVLVFGLQFLAKKSAWSLPDVLGGTVAGIAGITFAVLMYEHMDWHNFSVYPVASFGELLGNGPLLGGLMLCAGALVSAFAFKRRLALLPNIGADTLRTTRTTLAWFLVAAFWWCGFTLYGVAHALAYLTAARAAAATTVWYEISFWAAYSIGLSLSALVWTELALRKQFPHRRWILLVFWPTLTALGGFAFWKQMADQLWWSQRDWNNLVSTTVGDAWLNLLAGPLVGAIILCGLAWHGAFKIERGALPSDEPQSAAANERTRSTCVALWLSGLGLAWYLLVIDALALFAANVLHVAGNSHSDMWWQFGYRENGMLLVVASAMSFLALAKHKQWLALRWLATPAAALQAVASAAILFTLYVQGALPSLTTGLALIGCWLGMAWCLRYWLHAKWQATQRSIRLIHFGRVIATWMMIAPLVSLRTWHWLVGDSAEHAQTLADSGWVVAGMWPDYLAAWVSIASLFVLLRQAKHAGWPLRPLHAWYGTFLIPLATLWAVLLSIYWNLRQNGNMSPLPYLPLLNPLDITSGFVALLVTLVWQANKTRISTSQRSFGIKAAMTFSFGWFNLMLLRTAAQYLHLPYKFDALYASQFVQAMLSIVWTLSAFVLMRFAVRKLSKPLWLVGAALLAVVVGKLAFVDLSNVGSVARIVSFMGVGGLMVVIGYLAPLPRASEESK